jgi:hypothetical protein
MRHVPQPRDRGQESPVPLDKPRAPAPPTEAPPLPAPDPPEVIARSWQGWLE